MSKPFNFLNGELTLCWVDFVAIVFQLGESGVQELEMVLPRIVGGSGSEGILPSIIS